MKKTKKSFKGILINYLISYFIFFICVILIIILLIGLAALLIVIHNFITYLSSCLGVYSDLASIYLTFVIFLGLISSFIDWCSQ